MKIGSIFGNYAIKFYTANLRYAMIKHENAAMKLTPLVDAELQRFPLQTHFSDSNFYQTLAVFSLYIYITLVPPQIAKDCLGWGSSLRMASEVAIESLMIVCGAGSFAGSPSNLTIAPSTISVELGRGCMVIELDNLSIPRLLGRLVRIMAESRGQNGSSPEAFGPAVLFVKELVHPI